MDFRNHYQTVLDNETLYVKNQIFDPNQKGFVFPFSPLDLQPFVMHTTINRSIYDDSSSNTIHIKEPVFVVDTLDGCWSHAIIDNIIVWLWSYQKYMANQEIVFVIRRRLFDCYPDNYKIISNTGDQTKFVEKYEQLLSVIPHKYILLEQNIKSRHCFDNCFHYTLEDHRQRSLWNTHDIYPGRSIFAPKYSDEEIYEHANYFVQGLRNKLNIYIPSGNQKKHVIVIDRKYDRFFDKVKLDKLEEALLKDNTESFVYEGVVILENMALKEQIALFSRTHVFFFRHGSCLANLLWAPPNSLVFDIDERMNRRQIVQRVCDLTKSKSQHVPYEEFDVDRMMNFLNTYLGK